MCIRDRFLIYILVDVLIEVLGPEILVFTFDFQRSVDQVLERDQLVIDPRIRIIKLKHVQTPFTNIYTVFYRS